MQFLVQMNHGGFKCTLCGKVANYRGNMKRHMVLKHTKPTNDVCKYCGKMFRLKFYLNRHIRNRECLSGMLFDAPNADASSSSANHNA